MLKKGKIELDNGEIPKNIAIIHCVGSRNKSYHEYCSRTCCMTGLKYANILKTNHPESNVFELYADMRSFGKANEEFYKDTAKKGVIHLMFEQSGDLPLISKGDGDNLKIEFHELLSGEDVRVDVDMVILLSAMESHDDAKEMSHQAGISLCGNNFYIEKHPKLDPVATTTDGVYVVGSCQAPKEIPDSIAQAKAATARILATIERGSVSVEVTTASINSDICCGCQFCIKVCPYTAISFNKEEGVSEVNEALCKGCGTCGSACPSGAITSKHFTDLQIFSQIEGLMNMDIELKEIKI
jgi:heterodisulfide reductase subunit A